MAFRTLIIVGILFLIHSCAQIGTLSGGIKDEIAPKPIDAKMDPIIGSTNFHGSEIKIPFSEFIKLEKPTETMVLIPPHAKLTTKIKGKTVYIHLSDSLHENTTYSIYMNGTVKDITEGNDSLMQIVFSTGNTIDSLGYQVKVIDAFTNQPILNCLVALYEDKTDSIIPTYFVKTDLSGTAKFTFLKEGTYTLLAFEDKNKDMFLQLDERLAFRNEKVNLSSLNVDTNSVLIDSLPLRLFVPVSKPRLKSLTFKAPGMFVVGANYPLNNASFSVNNHSLNEKDVHFFKEDSLSFLYSLGDSSRIEFVATTSYSDTISKPFTKNEKAGKITYTHNLIADNLYPSDTLTFAFTDEIKEINPSLIKFENKEDSTQIPIEKLTFTKNNLKIIFKKGKLKTLEILLLPNSIITLNSSLKDTIRQKVLLKAEKDFGSIKLDASEYQEAIVVEVLVGGVVERSLSMLDKKNVLIERILPGEYTFRVIIDDNKNGKWDTGNRDKILFPEIIYTFSEITKVRANWEVDLKLTTKLD